MQKTHFKTWMASERKFNDRTISSRMSNCERVEEFEGDLDSHFDADGLRQLIERLAYTKELMLRSLEELEFIKGMTHRLEIEPCPQGNMIESMSHTEPCQATCSINRQKTMIALRPNRAGRRLG